MRLKFFFCWLAAFYLRSSRSTRTQSGDVVAMFRFAAFLVLGSAFVTLFLAIVQTHRLSSEPKVLSFADRWNGVKPMR